MFGDGVMVRRPYRLASKINFEDQHLHPNYSSTKPRPTKSSPAPGDSHRRLFVAPSPKPVKPRQVTLFDKPEVHKTRSNKPLPVSPITGHIIGTGGNQFVHIPKRPVRSP